jgi:hypothetical protein
MQIVQKKLDLFIIKSMIQKGFGAIDMMNGWGLASPRTMNACFLLPPSSWELGLSHICAYCNIPIIATHYERWQALLSSLNALWEWIFIHLSLCILINKVATCFELTQMLWNLFVRWILDIKWQHEKNLRMSWKYFRHIITYLAFVTLNLSLFTNFVL